MRAAAIRRVIYVAYSLAFLGLALGLLAIHSSAQQRSVFGDFAIWTLAMAAVASISAWVFQLGDTTRGWGFADSIWAGLKAAILTFLLISAAGLLAVRALPRQITLGFLVLMPVTVLLIRLPFRRVAESMAARRLVVVGTEEEVEELSSQLAPHQKDYSIVAHVNGFRGKARPSDIGEWLEVGENQLREAVVDNVADMVVIGPTKLNDFDLLARISEVHAKGVRVRTFGEFYEERFGKVPLSAINETWFFFDSGELHRSTYMRFRRGVDLISGLVGVIVFALAFPFVALAIKLGDGGPVFYSQERVGQGGKIFNLLKFRTMRTDAEADGPRWAEPGDDRATKIGRFLRKSRIDELPQFVNVLRGDLSLIGPRAERPEFVAQLEELIPFYSRRHLIRPGLTGWAQVSYQYGSSVEHAMEKLQYEFYYMKYQSVLLDLRIMANTARVVFSLSGV